MDFATYWQVVPIVGLVLNSIAIAALWLTRKHRPEPAE
jgi:hypothetical protein